MGDQNKDEITLEVLQNIHEDVYHYEYIIIGTGWFLILIGVLIILLEILTVVYHNKITIWATGFILIILGLLLLYIGRIIKRSKYRELKDLKYTLKSYLNRKHI